MITQIYEIQTPEEAEAVGAVGVDHIGSVVLAAEKWRQPELRETIQRVRDIKKKSTLITLFNDPDTVCKALDYYQPDIIHFCEMLPGGREGMGICRRLIALQEIIRQRYPGLKIMRSIPIERTSGSNSMGTLALAEQFQPTSDFFLTDTVLTNGHDMAAQPVAGFVGITGETCHWDTARMLVNQATIPVILAGGLSPENVYRGVCTVKPAGVDSCTRTNRENNEGIPIRFQKDVARVKRFVDEARRAAADIAEG